MATYATLKTISPRIYYVLSNSRAQATLNPVRNLSRSSGYYLRPKSTLGRVWMPPILHRLCPFPPENTSATTALLTIQRASWCSTAGSRPCWKCGAITAALNFCEECEIIQPVKRGVNYFEVLGVPTQFDIAPKQLTQKFRQLQRRLHPDRFTQKSEEEQQYSDDQSSLVNKSYQTLLKPLSRGLYLLDLHGASLEEGEIHLDPVFLMEIMEINEELAETRDIEVIQRIGADNHRTLQELIAVAADAFAKDDIDSAKKTLARLKYYANIDDKVTDFELKYSEKM